MGHADTDFHATPPDDPGAPSVGEIKRALCGLAPAAPDAPLRDYAQVLREIHELMRRCARINGIDPDAALQRHREASQPRVGLTPRVN